MASVSFVVLVPYKYKEGNNEEISHFLELFKSQPKNTDIRIEIILQPNFILVRNRDFILRVKNAAFPDWTDVARVVRLDGTNRNKFRYDVTHVLDPT